MNSHTVSWECINCYPLATSEQTQAHSHTLEWLLQGHLLLLTPFFLGLSLFFSPAVFFTFAPLCTTTAYQLIHSQRDTHTHAHDEHKTPSPSHVWARTQSSWLTQNWAVICVTSGLCVCAFVCVFMLCVLASPWAGSALWEVTVNMHKLGCTGRGTGLWFDHHRRHRENMTNTAALHARESPLRFWRAPSAPARASTQTLECFHCMRTDWVTNEINCKKMIKYSYFSWQ